MASRGILTMMALLLWSGAAVAIDRIVLEIGAVSVAGARVSDVAVALDLRPPAPTAVVTAEHLAISQPAVAFSEVHIGCTELVIKEPEFFCRRARITARGSPTATIDLHAAAGYDTAKRLFGFKGSNLAAAGGHIRFDGQLASDNWSVIAHADKLHIPALRKLMAPWIALPPGFSVEGRLTADAKASARAGAMQAQLDAHTDDLNFSNEAGTIVGEKLQARMAARVRQSGEGFDIDAKLGSAAGQTLAGPVLLDFGANPLQLTAQGSMLGKTLELNDISIAQKNLLSAHGEASVRVGGKPTINHARADLTRVQFPAAYTSFLQIALAATGFGALETSGTARGAIEVADDEIRLLEASIEDLDLKDDAKRFAMSDLRGDMHWALRADANVEPSHLAWSKASAYGLIGGTAELNFIARGAGFELTREAHVPIFDGAVVVHSMAARNLGAQAELDFDAHIEPISMTLLSKAFGWPELSGQLAGRIPGLTYRNNLLALNGDLTANVFDGTITGRNFRLRAPLGPWPRLFADFTARGLDLELVTSTFSIGSITGRMDADLKGLELFNWSPVAFDARLYSTPNDRSPHLISQKAVTRISSIGGGSGGVAKALQSGVLRFFDQFRYDRVGIACQLRNEVCLMAGVEPVGEGYYLVKGKGLPRIDIIGNAGRVDWPQLVTQIVAGMSSDNVVVR